MNSLQFIDDNFQFGPDIDVFHVDMTNDALLIDEDQRSFRCPVGPQESVLQGRRPMGPEIR
jgi:hypothetical protein